MEWDYERCLHLIELYKSKPELWNSRHSLYRVNSKKYEAWSEIANEIGTTVDVLKGKINSLLASYRRERAKEMKGIGKECSDGSRSQWFAYEAMQFLSTKNGSRRPLNTTTVESTSAEKKIKCEEVKLEENECEGTFLDDINEEIEQASHNTMFEREGVSWGKLEPDMSIMKDLVNAASNSKRLVGVKRKYDGERVEREDHRLTPSDSYHHQRNSCDVYGEHIALKLRSYSKTTQCAVQHLFGSILFKADMGVYDRELQNYHPSSTILPGNPRSPSPSC